MMHHALLPARREFLYELQHNLRLLDRDLEAKQAGFRYLFVVDFSAIYTYAYKIFRGKSVASIPQEPGGRVFARQQAALGLIFNGFADPLLLIPPYAAELDNHLKWVKLQIEITELDMHTAYREKLARMIEQSREFRRFVALKAEDVHDSMAHDSLSLAALEVGRKFFPELYLVVTCATSNGLDPL